MTNGLFAEDDLEAARYKLLELIYDNQAFYKEFFGSRLESPYVKKMVWAMYDRMRDLLIQRGTYDERTFEIAYQYNYYGVIGVLKEWLACGCPEKPKELGDILYTVVEKQYDRPSLSPASLRDAL